MPDEIDQMLIQTTMPIAFGESRSLRSDAKPKWSLPGSYGVYAADGFTRMIDVTLTGCLGPCSRNDSRNAIVARHASFMLAEDRTLFMRMGLERRCRFIECPQGQTCIEGFCEVDSVTSKEMSAYQTNMEMSVECAQNGIQYANTTTHQLLVPPARGRCTAGEICREGTCSTPGPPGGSISFTEIDLDPMGCGITSAPAYVVADDFDDDGHSDVAVVGDADVWVLWGPIAASGCEAPSRVLHKPGSHFISAAVGRLSLNGRRTPVLAVVDDMGSMVYLLRGAPDKSLRYLSMVSVPDIIPTAVSLGQSGDDAYPYLVLGSAPYQGVQVFVGDGSGTFTAAMQPPMLPSTLATLSPSPSAILLEDVDLDGKADLVIGGSSADTTGTFDDNAVPSSAKGVVAVLIGDGSGNFESQREYQLDIGVNSSLYQDLALQAVQLRGSSGGRDIVASNGTQVTALMNDGTGVFNGGTAPTAIDRFFSAFSAPSSIAAVDFDGDGHPDLALAGDTLGVFSGQGPGSFSPAWYFGGQQGWSVSAVAAADLTGDGRPDLVIAIRPIGAQPPSNLVILQNTSR